MGNRNEEYLDQLLNSMNGQEVETESVQSIENEVEAIKPEPIVEKKTEKKTVKKPEKKVEKRTEKETEKKSDKKVALRKEKASKVSAFRGNDTSGDDFLEEFDREMMQLDMEQVISDYEDSLGEELLGKKTKFGKNGLFGRKKTTGHTANVLQDTDKMPSEDTVMTIDETPEPVHEKMEPQTETDQMFAELEKMLSGNMTMPTPATEEVEKEETLAEHDELTTDHFLEEDTTEEDSDMTAGTMSDDDEALFNSLLSGEDSASASVQMDGGFEFGNLFGDPLESEESMNSDDVLSLLGEMSDDLELAEIGQMLQAQDNHEDIPFEKMVTGVSEQEAMTYIRDMDEEQPTDKAKRKVKWKFNKWDPEKKGFLHKISKLLFGEDEEQTIHVRATNGIEDTTAENDELIRAAEKEAALAEKKAKKAEKKKEQQKKNEEKKRVQSAEKKAKESAKKAKNAEKRAKAAKEVDKTPPLPKKPVFLIFLLALSIIFGTIFAANGMHYNYCLRTANEAYSKGAYVEAYRALVNTKIKEKDDELIREVSILAAMQELLYAYPTMYEAKEYEIALDMLIRVVGRYHDNLEEGTALEIVPLMEQLRVQAEEILLKEYGITYEEATTLYNMTSRKKYSVELIKILREVGLLESDTDK